MRPNPASSFRLPLPFALLIFCLCLSRTCFVSCCFCSMIHWKVELGKMNKMYLHTLAVTRPPSAQHNPHTHTKHIYVDRYSINLMRLRLVDGSVRSRRVKKNENLKALSNFFSITHWLYACIYSSTASIGESIELCLFACLSARFTVCLSIWTPISQRL